MAVAFLITYQEEVNTAYNIININLPMCILLITCVYFFLSNDFAIKTH